MKVWMNKRQGDYTGGMILVAANSKEEAHEFCVSSDKLENIYWEWYYGAEETKQEVYNKYDWDGWQEVPNLLYDGVNPCIIAEEGHSE